MDEMREREFRLDTRREPLDMLLGIFGRSLSDVLGEGRSPSVESNDPLLAGVVLPSPNPERTFFLPPGVEGGEFEVLLNDPCLERVASGV